MKISGSNKHGLSRRKFIQSSAAFAGAAILPPWTSLNTRAAAAPAVTRTAVDQVTLGA